MLGHWAEVGESLRSYSSLPYSPSEDGGHVDQLM